MKIWILAAVLVLTVVSMAYLGHLAIEEWHRSATTVIERRIDEVDALMMTALSRDMRGAQISILMPLDSEQILLTPPHELADIVAQAFARFPYPESFFAWNAGATSSGSTVLFNRTDRSPPWNGETANSNLFPVRVIRNSFVANRLVGIAQALNSANEHLTVFETNIEGIPYQVVTRFFHDQNGKAAAIVGFTVNVEWVKNVYFGELTRQIERIGGSPESTALSLSIIDENGKIVTQTRPPNGSAPSQERKFPFAFFDSRSVPTAALGHLSPQQWTARVSPADDALLGAAEKGVRRTSVLLFIAAASSVLGLLLAGYSLHRTLELAAMKTDFMAMVTHELKTPLAGISLVGETLSKRRYTSESSIAEYGALLSKETTRLKRLVENVLSFSRLTDARKIYSKRDVNVRELVLEAVERLEPLIKEKCFEMRLETSDSVRPVYCDREEMTRAFESLIENAIKYCDDVGKTDIRIFDDGINVNVSIRDNGIGILPEDIPHVFDRFYRGKNAVSDGSGLGLAIARTIITDHGGDISIGSVAGGGTLVKIVLPAHQEST
jgi:signal transduction histidine kinase